MEIYNETIIDLLCDDQKVKHLKIREDSNVSKDLDDCTGSSWKWIYQQSHGARGGIQGGHTNRERKDTDGFPVCLVTLNSISIQYLLRWPKLTK